MPESCFLCLDSTEYMRNGDYFPNRLLAMLETATLLVSAKTELNAENTVGFLTAGGTACTVYETLTMEVDRVLSSLGHVKIMGKVCHFSAALRIAALALSHRSNPRSEKRIVVFVGSPLQETAKELEALAKKLRKDDVGVDVIAFGVPQNVELLRDFVDKVNKQDNSFFINVSEGSNLTGVLMDTRVFTGAGGVSEGGAGAGFAVDPNADPDLQMALRLSMEDHQQSAGQPQGAPPQPVVQQPPMMGGAESFEEQLRRAIALSLMDAQNSSNSAENNGTAEPEARPPAPNATAEEEEDEEEYMRQVQQAIEQSKKENKDKEEE